MIPILRAHERTVEAYEIADQEELAQINDRRQLAEVTALAQARIHVRHQLAGVTIVNPGHGDRRGGHDRDRHGDRALHQRARHHHDRFRRAGRASPAR